MSNRSSYSMKMLLVVILLASVVANLLMGVTVHAQTQAQVQTQVQTPDLSQNIFLGNTYYCLDSGPDCSRDPSKIACINAHQHSPDGVVWVAWCDSYPGQSDSDQQFNLLNTSANVPGDHNFMIELAVTDGGQRLCLTAPSFTGWSSIVLEPCNEYNVMQAFQSDNEDHIGQLVLSVTLNPGYTPMGLNYHWWQYGYQWLPLQLATLDSNGNFTDWDQVWAIN